MLKKLNTQIKAHRLGAVLLIIGYAICILCFSIGINYSNYVKQLNIYENNGYSDDNMQITVNLTEEIDWQKFYNVVDKLSQNVELQLMRQGTDLTKTQDADLKAVTFNKYPEWTIPLLSGRYISLEDVKKGNMVAVIGTDLIKCTYEKGGNKYINFTGEKYKVIGVGGRKDSSNIYNKVIYIPFKSISQNVKNTINDDSQLTIFLRKNGQSPINEARQLVKAIKGIDENAVITQDTIDNVSIESYKLRNTIIEVILILITGIINVINLSVFWILDRKKELAVKKTFGANNYNIAYEIFKELFVLSLYGAILAVSFQYIIDHFFNTLFSFPISPSIVNFVLIFLLSVLCSIIVTAVLFAKIVNIQPAEALK
jgi:putative ABC transport system permease protein